MKKTTLAFVISAFSAPVFAEGNFYAEVMLGFADQETSIGSMASTSGDDTSFGVRGGYQFSQYVAMEIAYQNYGEAEDTFTDVFGDTINEKFETTAINLGVKGILPVEGPLSLNARLGLSAWDYELEETDSSLPGQVFKVDDDGTDLYYGVGAQYDVNDSLFVAVEYTVFEADASILGLVSADHEVKNLTFSIGSNF